MRIPALALLLLTTAPAPLRVVLLPQGGRWKIHASGLAPNNPPPFL